MYSRIYYEPVPHTLESITSSSQGVEDVLHQFNAVTAPEPDLITPPSSKKALMYQLYHNPIFNRSIKQRYFPNSWKEANVSPNYKKEDKSLSSDYRPISLICQAGKPMEQCIYKYLSNLIVSSLKVSEYDQEIPQSHTADQPTAP